jgi:hypothetical protein
MTLFEDNLQLSFTLPAQIHGEPTYGTLAELTQMLQANAASVPSTCTLGGALHGYLALIISDEAYAMKSNTLFVVPEPPLLNPDLDYGTFPSNTTTWSIAPKAPPNILLTASLMHVPNMN